MRNWMQAVSLSIARRFVDLQSYLIWVAQGVLMDSNLDRVKVRARRLLAADH